MKRTVLLKLNRIRQAKLQRESLAEKEMVRLKKLERDNWNGKGNDKQANWKEKD